MKGVNKVSERNDDRLQRLVRLWRERGYTEEHHFQGEYVLLVDPVTLLRVRVYEHGDVWMQHATGEYVQEPNAEFRGGDSRGRNVAGYSAHAAKL